MLPVVEAELRARKSTEVYAEAVDAVRTPLLGRRRAAAVEEQESWEG